MWRRSAVLHRSACMAREHCHEPSPPAISPAGGGRCRRARRCSPCVRGRLSEPAGALDRRLHACRPQRHRCAPDGAVADGADGPDVRHRAPPWRGNQHRGHAPALTDLMAGQIEVLFPSLGSSIEYVKTGKLRALAVTGDTRSDALPDVRTVAETLPGYQAASFYGIGAPRNTPAEIVEVLNKAVNAGLVDPKLNARLADLGNVPLPGPPATFGKLIADETEKWGKVIRFAGIKSQ